MRKVTMMVLVLILLVSLIPLQVSAAYENTHTNTGDQRADIIAVALTQVGYQEGKGTGSYNNDTKYSDWAGHPKTEWCGWFVSWCAEQANVPKSVIPKNGLASPSGFGYSTCYTSREYTPRPGDLFFKTGHTHVGLVYYVEGDYFYTIEGNTSTSGWEGHSVMIRRRALNEFCFVSPRYTSDSGSSVPPAHTHSYQKSFESSHPHKEIARCACGSSYYTGETQTVADCSTCKAQNCSHTYGSWVNYNSSNHQKTCTKCGNAVSQSHSWVDDEVTKEPTCKAKGSKNQHCSVCNRTRTQSIDKLETHNFSDWIAVDQEKHRRVCQDCDKEETGEHYLIQDKNGVPILQSDDRGHWEQCADCCQKTNTNLHEVKPAQDETGHWQQCTDCERVLEKQAHSFINACDTDCDDCTYTRKTTHVFDSTLIYDKESHWYPCVHCGQQKDAQKHTYELVPREDGKQAETCSQCGQLSGKVVSKEEGGVFNLDKRWYFAAAVPLALMLLIWPIAAIKKRKKK